MTYPFYYKFNQRIFTISCFWGAYQSAAGDFLL